MNSLPTGQMALEACEFVTRLFSQPLDPSPVEINAVYEQCRAVLTLANEEGEKYSIAAIVNRFLAWPLPKTFAPDCGISFDGRNKDALGYDRPWPIGTNLFTAVEARQMIEHILLSEQGPKSSNGSE